MQAIILSIGDELVLGQTVDTNSAYLSAELVARGIGTRYHQTIADDRAAIRQAIIEASKAAKLVIISGGLGPTDDDLTRDALADAMGVNLVIHLPSVEVIRAMFIRRSREMPERNKVQAMHPVGSEVIPNSCGTAPGIKAHLNGATIYVTPGVPSEMLAMWRLSIGPDIDKLTPGNNPGSNPGNPTDNLSANPSLRRNVILTTKINTFGKGESAVAEKLGSLMDRKRNPVVGTTVAGGVVSVRVRSEFPEHNQARAAMDETIALIEKQLGPIIYGRDETTIQETVVAMLREARLLLVTAESCTGGSLGKMITDVSGSSEIYLGGWVTYANAMKTSQLGVPTELIDLHGAVSEPVARAMAEGALTRGKASLALSVTGIAGPEGGTIHKPVGTVFIGLASKTKATSVFRLDLGGDRVAVRDRAAKSALQLLRFDLMGVSLDALGFGRIVS